MFTTGQHWMLYSATALSAATIIFSLLKYKKAAVISLSAIILLQGLYLLGRGWVSGIFFINPIVEGPYFLPWCMAIISLYLVIKENSAAAVVTAGTLAAFIFGCYFARGIIPPTPRKITNWAFLFFLTENISHSFFLSGGLAALAWFRNSNNETFNRLLLWGFVAFSVSQVAGAWWCFIGWGNTFSWGPRHMTSAFIWLIYAAYIHLRFINGWTAGKRAAWAVISFIFVIITVYGHHLHEMTFKRVGG